MFEGFKNKMTKFYDDMKTKIKRDDDNQPDQDASPQGPTDRRTSAPKPVIHRPTKPAMEHLNNSLVNSMSDSDLDMRRLDEFHFDMSSQRSFDNEGLRRVAYYDQHRNQQRPNRINRGNF